jgi:hypothetical protein
MLQRLNSLRRAVHINILACTIAAITSNSFDSSVLGLPAELGDREAAKGDKLNSGRSNNSINDAETAFIYAYTGGEPQEKVVLKATRAPEEKLRRQNLLSSSNTRGRGRRSKVGGRSRPK